MKKTRYIPYGYTMRNGRTVISGEEAEVIREIFNSYLNGASLKAIADELTDRQIPYTQRLPYGTKPVLQESSITPDIQELKSMIPS